MSIDNPRLTVDAANQSGERAGSMAAQWTYDPEAGAYYFAPMQATAPPYLKQRHVEAIIDIAADGTLAGVELIDNMPPPPALATPPAQPAPSKCEDCSGSGLALNSAGEPDICKTCGGNTVVPHGKPDGAVREALRNMCDANRDYALASNAKNARRLEQCMREAEAALHSPKIAAAETSPELKPWRDELSEIIGHLGSAIVQSCAKDDQIIMDHVKAAHEIAQIVRRKA